MKRTAMSIASCVALLVVRDAAARTDICYEGGPLLPNFQLNGSATLNGTDLLITPDQSNQNGSLFYFAPLSSSGDIHVQLQLKITTTKPNGADGMAFVMHNDPRGVKALGNPGEGIGYGTNGTDHGTLVPISPSVIVEMDTFNNGFDSDDNHVAIVKNGDPSNHLARFTPAFSMKNWNSANGTAIPAQPFFVWIDYTAANTTFKIYVTQSSTKPATPQITYNQLNLATVFNNKPFFMGFTGSTGGQQSKHEIVNFVASDSVLTETVCCASGTDCNGSPLGSVCDSVKHVCSQCTPSDFSQCSSAPLPGCDISGASDACIPKCTGDFGTGLAGSCLAANAPVCVTFGPSAGSCVACNGNFGGGANHACGSAGAPSCSFSTGYCGFCHNNADCDGLTCASATGVCNGCDGNFGSGTTNACLAPAPFCNGGACLPACQRDSDCGSSQFCAGASVGNPSGCQPLIANGQPVPGGCTGTSKAHCATDACDASDNKCGLALGDGTCSTLAQCRAGVCIASGGNSGKCKSCANDHDCTTPAATACDTSTNQCVQCTSANNSACTSSTPICVQKTCAACTGDNGSGAVAACPTAANPFCDATGACRACSSNAECTTGTHQGSICDAATGACGTACNNDADCAAGNWCNNPSGGSFGGNCAPRVANGQPLPPVTPIGGTCTPANAQRICISGVCDVGDNLCGRPNSRVCVSAAQCRSAICENGICGKVNGESCTAVAQCRGGVCYADGQCGAINGQPCTDSRACRGGTCAAFSGLCGKDNGQPCAAAVECRSAICFSDGKCGDPDGQPCSGGDVCRSDVCVHGVCAAICGTNADCATGTVCKSGSCTPAPASGCTTNVQCGLGNVCTNGVCVPGLPNAKPCSVSAQCASQICFGDGSCGKPTGHPCALATDCRSNVCDGTGTCVATCAQLSDCPAKDVCQDSACTVRTPNGNKPGGANCTTGTQCLSGTCGADGSCGGGPGDLCSSRLECRSGICDSTDGRCGLANGKGPCVAASTTSVCRSDVCDGDGKCGYANGDGPCGDDNAKLICRDGASCNAGKCGSVVKEIRFGGGGCTSTSGSGIVALLMVFGLLARLVSSDQITNKSTLSCGETSGARCRWSRLLIFITFPS